MAVSYPVGHLLVLLITEPFLQCYLMEALSQLMFPLTQTHMDFGPVGFTTQLAIFLCGG